VIVRTPVCMAFNLMVFTIQDQGCPEAMISLLVNDIPFALEFIINISSLFSLSLMRTKSFGSNSMENSILLKFFAFETTKGIDT
jgi:hypothetical protein